jgi:hypothetical protein
VLPAAASGEKQLAELAELVEVVEVVEEAEEFLCVAEGSVRAQCGLKLLAYLAGLKLLVHAAASY